jgi:hypothetical protein
MKFSKVQISEVISKLNIGKVFPTNLRKFSKFFSEQKNGKVLHFQAFSKLILIIIIIIIIIKTLFKEAT